MRKNKKDGLTVTDHAIVRYLERVQGLNVDHVKRLIATDYIQSVHRKVGDGIIKTEKFTVVVKKDKILTVY